MNTRSMALLIEETLMFSNGIQIFLILSEIRKCLDKLFEMISQELKTRGRKCQVLRDFDICCRKLMELKVTSFHACVRSFCSVK